MSSQSKGQTVHETFDLHQVKAPVTSAKVVSQTYGDGTTTHWVYIFFAGNVWPAGAIAFGNINEAFEFVKLLLRNPDDAEVS